MRLLRLSLLKGSIMEGLLIVRSIRDYVVSREDPEELRRKHALVVSALLAQRPSTGAGFPNPRVAELDTGALGYLARQILGVSKLRVGGPERSAGRFRGPQRIVPQRF